MLLRWQRTLRVEKAENIYYDVKLQERKNNRIHCCADNNLRANDRDPVRRVDLFSDFNFFNGYYSYIFYFKILNHSYYAFRGQSVFLWYTIMIFYRFVDGCGYLLCSLSYQLLQINKLCWQFRVLFFLSVPEWASIG